MSIIVATCATIAGILSGLAGGETVNLNKQDCSAVSINRYYPKRVTINAGRSVVRGLTVQPGAGNVRWRSGTLVAPKGKYANAADGYAARIQGGAKDVRFDNVTFTEARMGLVIGAASNVTVADSKLYSYGSDGIHISGAADGVTIVRNEFRDPDPRPTQCLVTKDDGTKETIFGMSSRACVAIKGLFRDGDHSDAIQMRNGGKNILIRFNRATGKQQAFSEMRTGGDKPLSNVACSLRTP